MAQHEYDLAVVGSGFGGSLLSIIARQCGLSVALIERGTHPRFAIGESSTPLADFKLARIAKRYGLDWLKPLAKYGPWKRQYPQIPCGLKRGFSFFQHTPKQAFCHRATNDTALLVAASPDDEHADTHWFRAAFDAHIVERAQSAGVDYLDQFETTSITHQTHDWRILGARPTGNLSIRASFVVDATGDGQLLARTLDIPSTAPESLRAQSRGLYSHFTDVSKWHDILVQEHGDAAVRSHPFPCDAAALHHIIEHGWMWVLRFENGITSAGFSLHPDHYPIRSGESAEAEWKQMLDVYPSIGRQFDRAQPIRPFTRTGRLQRRLSQAAGVDWAMLPHAAGFLDPWLSPGIAQTLYAVDRLGGIFAEEWKSNQRSERLAAYNSKTLNELAWVDQITGCCFECFDRFDVLCAVSMVYFIAAIFCEEQETEGAGSPDPAFLLADHAEYRSIAADIFDLAPKIRADQNKDFVEHARSALSRYDRGGLCDPEKYNMYPYVCLPRL